MSIKDNLRAIALLKTLQSENRKPYRNRKIHLKQIQRLGSIMASI